MKLKPNTIIPTPDEDAAITAAAMQDPDATPFTDAEWKAAKKVIPIAAIKARAADPQTKIDAIERIDILNARLPLKKARALMDSLGGQAIRARSAKAKVKALREMVAVIGDAVSDLAACGKGCSACCHVSVVMGADEAVVIGREIGVAPKVPAQFIKPGEHDAREYYGTPCPFLVNSECSIYESRPLACRTLFNMDKDALMCTIVPGDPPRVFYLNHMPQTTVIAEAFEDCAHLHADIRDFFPKGKGR